MQWALWLFLFLHWADDSNNLLRNGGFEAYHNCPTHTDNFYEVKDWFAVTGSPNYYNCGIGRHPTENGVFELDSSYEGSGYAGIGLFAKGHERGPESIGQLLDQPILKGHGYVFNCMVKPATGKKYSNRCIHLSLLAFAKDPTGLEGINVCPPDTAVAFVLCSGKTKPSERWVPFELKFITPNDYRYLVLSPVCSDGCNAYIFLDDLILREIPGP